MADYDCEYCPHEDECSWQYDGTICRVAQIKAAKTIVNDDYKNVFASILAKNEAICDERIECLLSLMREIMHDSLTDLPAWANTRDNNNNSDMTRTEMIAFIRKNPHVFVAHTLFDESEYIYTGDDGFVYDENGYLFEDWGDGFGSWNRNNSIRTRIGGQWEDGWYIK